MAYVPPALRKKQQQPAGDGELNTADENARPLEDPTNNLAPNKQPLYHRGDIHDHYWSNGKKIDHDSPAAVNEGLRHGTLNASAAEPDKLKYVMLFEDANPRWHSDGLIFVKTNLNLLPGSEQFSDDKASEMTSTNDTDAEHNLAEQGVRCRADLDELKEDCKTEMSSTEKQIDDVKAENTSVSNSRRVNADNSGSTYTPDLSLYNLGPIAIFEQVGGRNGAFRFLGYHKLGRLVFLAPHSQELLRMLEQKFTMVDRLGQVKQQQRSRNSWEASMGHRWAVIKLEKDGEADAALLPPDIKIRERRENTLPRKSVNELLKDMRLES